MSLNLKIRVQPAFKVGVYKFNTEQGAQKFIKFINSLAEAYLLEGAPASDEVEKRPLTELDIKQGTTILIPCNEREAEGAIYFLDNQFFAFEDEPNPPSPFDFVEFCRSVKASDFE